MAESFEQAAIALTAVITGPAKVLAKNEVRIERRTPTRKRSWSSG